MIIRIDKYFIEVLKQYGIDSKFLIDLYRQSRLIKKEAELKNNFNK